MEDFLCMVDRAKMFIFLYLGRIQGCLVENKITDVAVQALCVRWEEREDVAGFSMESFALLGWNQIKFVAVLCGLF